MSTITLDDTFQNYFKDSFIKYVLCEIFSSVEYQTIITAFTVCRNLQAHPPVLKIILQWEMIDFDYGWEKNNECKVAITSIFSSEYHHRKRIYDTY